MDDVTQTMKSTMGSATKALPPETIDDICQYLASDGILSLRAVCRDTCRKVEDTFLTRFFTHRRQLISKYSLQQFLDISAHPVLRQKLKSVEFVRAEINSDWRPSYGSFDDPKLVFEFGELRATDDEEHMKRSRWLKEEKQVTNKWSTYREELGYLLDLEVITRALQNLKCAGIIPALLVSGNPWGSSPAHGVHELHRVLGLALEKHHPMRSHHDFVSYQPPFADRLNSGIDVTKLLLKSIVEAQFPIQDLTMSSQTLPICFEELGLIDQSDLSHALHSSMFQLRRLSFALNRQLDRLNPDELAIFLSAAPSLQSLVIHFDMMHGRVPDRMCAAFAGLKLQSLELVHARVPRHDLKQILVSQQSTLRDLTLTLVGFVEAEEIWTPTLQLLATDFSLTSIDLLLYQGPRRIIIGERTYRSGSAAVQLGLAELISEAEKEPTEYDSAEDEEDDGDSDLSDWFHNEGYYDYGYDYESDGGGYDDYDEGY